MTTDNRCHGHVSNGPRTVSFHRCYSKGTLEHNGKLWCKLHHPPTVDAKQEARLKRWDAEQKEQHRKWAQQALLIAKGRLFDEAMVAVKLLALVCSGTATNKNSLITALEKARVIMEKAKDLK